MSKLSLKLCVVLLFSLISVASSFPENKNRESGGESPEVYDRENTTPTAVTRRTLFKDLLPDNTDNGSDAEFFGTNFGNRRPIGGVFPTRTPDGVGVRTIISFRQTRRCVNRVCETVTCHDDDCKTTND
ncbi:unnamed protein product [Diamesa serratosioi]